ncbi:sensor histidine kinase [Ferruginibacter profundus]
MSHYSEAILEGFLKICDQQKFADKNLLIIKLDQDEVKIKSSLTTIQHDQLYHIIKECISNVIKHANASELMISILFNDGKCNFTISDNGKGYEKDKIIYGIGIHSITQRVKDIGGDFTIDSTSGTGTTIKGNFNVG